MGKIDISVVQAAKAKMESRGSQIRYDKLTQGKNLRRILFPKGDYNNFYEEGYMHFGIGEDKKTFTCPKTFDPRAKCPICEYSERMSKSKDKSEKQQGDMYRARKRAYVNVINRDSDNEIDEPLVLPIGTTILKQLIGIICDPDYGDITDFENGRDVTIKRSGTGLNTEYDVLPKPNTSVASTTVSQEHLDAQMADLKSIFKEPAYEDLHEALYGPIAETRKPPEPTLGASTPNYEDMTVDELIEECIKRGLEPPEGASRAKLMTILSTDDEQGESEVLGDINAMLSRRKGR